MDILEIFTQPFMLRAIYGGIVIALMAAILGVFVTLRKQSFLSDGVAHASLAGIAVGIYLSVQPLIFAVIVAVLMAIGITHLQKRSAISNDAVIGIFYSVLFALGVVVVNLTPGFRPELFSYLFGSILSITWGDLAVAVFVFSIVIVFISFKYSQLVYATFDPESAKIRGVKVDMLEYILNILISIAIVVSIKLVGVIMVTALLIIPASTAKLLAKNFRQMIPISVSYSLLTTLLGIIISYYADTPTGATIVVTAGIGFLLVSITKGLVNR